MDIGTIVAGLNALSNIFNQPVPMTPAQVEEKPKKVEQTPMNPIFILPNQTPSMGIGVPPSPPLFMPSNVWNELLFANTPKIVPSLLDLYRLYFNTRF
jgi:hypothetical protein